MNTPLSEEDLPQPSLPTSWPKRPVRWPLAALGTLTGLSLLSPLGYSAYQWLRGEAAPWEEPSTLVGTFSLFGALFEMAFGLLLPSLLGLLILFVLVPVWRGKARNGKVSAALLGIYGVALFVAGLFTGGLAIVDDTVSTALGVTVGAVLLALSVPMLGVAVGGWSRWGGARPTKRPLGLLAAPVAAVAAGFVLVPLTAPLPEYAPTTPKFAAASQVLKTGAHTYTYTAPKSEGEVSVPGTFDYQKKTVHQDAYAFDADYTVPAVDASGSEFTDSTYLLGAYAPWQVLDKIDAGGGTWKTTTAGGVTTQHGEKVDCDRYNVTEGWDSASYREKQARVRWYTPLYCDVTVTLKGDAVQEVAWAYEGTKPGEFDFKYTFVS